MPPSQEIACVRFVVWCDFVVFFGSWLPGYHSIGAVTLPVMVLGLLMITALLLPLPWEMLMVVVMMGLMVEEVRMAMVMVAHS